MLKNKRKKRLHIVRVCGGHAIVDGQFAVIANVEEGEGDGQLKMTVST